MACNTHRQDCSPENNSNDSIPIWWKFTQPTWLPCKRAFVEQGVRPSNWKMPGASGACTRRVLSGCLHMQRPQCIAGDKSSPEVLHSETDVNMPSRWGGPTSCCCSCVYILLVEQSLARMAVQLNLDLNRFRCLRFCSSLPGGRHV